jgi:hypothetical protein
MSRWTTAGKILLIGGVVYFIDLFLPWQQVCIHYNLGALGNVGGCGSASGFHGFGFLSLLIVLAIIAMEVITLMGVQLNIGDAAQMGMISMGLAGGLLVCTVLKILIDHQDLAYGSWIGLVVAIVMAYGGYMRMQESKAVAPPTTGGAGTGGFTS